MAPILVGIIVYCSSFVAYAQPKTSQPQIIFNSFTGIYHLSRDSKGLSLLTIEETILADFPGNGSFYGITRVLPKSFQSHSLNIKVLNVSDAAGNIVPFKTSEDKDGNLVITTGDPGITLYGSQTIKIRYQTTGVVNLEKAADEFLLNVNGRGWNQGFNKVNATVHIPASFQASLKGKPSCYIALNNVNNANCEISIKNSPQETLITSRAQSLAAHQALVLKLNFKHATFTNSHASAGKKIILSLAAIIGAVALVGYFYKNKKGV
jgi:hypothetical protein